MFRAGVNVGVDITAETGEDFDAVVLAGVATDWRDLPIPAVSSTASTERWSTCRGRTKVNRATRSSANGQPPTAKDKRVIIIGGGDTGADCLGTSLRQGARSVHQFEIMPRPPEQRAESTPWPTYPLMFRVSSAHGEGGERVFSVNTEKFVGGDGRVTGLRPTRLMKGGRFEKVEVSGRTGGRPRAAGDGLRRSGEAGAADRPGRGTHRPG